MSYLPDIPAAICSYFMCEKKLIFFGDFDPLGEDDEVVVAVMADEVVVFADIFLDDFCSSNILYQLLLLLLISRKIGDQFIHIIYTRSRIEMKVLIEIS